MQSYTEPDLWVIDLTPDAKPRNLTSGFDWDISFPVFGDNGPPRAGGGNLPLWSADGKSMLEIFSKQGRTNLGPFDVASGALTEMTKGDQAVVRFRATADGSKIVYLVSTPTRIDDLYSLGQSGESDAPNEDQSRTVREIGPDRAGRNLLREFRRQKNSGVGAETAWTLIRRRSIR